jgi:hypothetical protein
MQFEETPPSANSQKLCHNKSALLLTALLQ